MLEDCHHVGQRDDLIPGVDDADVVVGAVEVLQVGDADRQRRGLVDGVTHLVYVPVGTQERGVDYPHVCPDVLHLLGIPEREGVVVAVGDEDSVLPYRREIVPGHLHSGFPVAAVVVVPVLLRHQRRHPEAEGHGAGGGGLPGLTARNGREPFAYAGDGKAYPNREGVERTGICIIPLPDLIRRLVEVYDYGDSGEEEEQEGHPGAPLVLSELVEEPNQAQEQRQEVIVVLAFVLAEYGRGIPLVSEPELVYGPDAALPVTVEYLAWGRAVYVVLSSDEVPHEVSPVHPVHLEVEEEPEVRPESRLLVLRARDIVSLSVHI